MAIQVRASTFDNLGYYYNEGYLRKALKQKTVRLEGVNDHQPTEFVFNTARVYDFIRSAKSTIRDSMTTFLSQDDVLPGLQAEDRQMIKEPFECFFSNLTGYTRSLNQDPPQPQVESMNMLIFNDADGDEDQQYVAHVGFACNSRRITPQHAQFTVKASLACQRFTYFPLQEEDFEAVLQAVQNLHVTDE